MAKARTKKSTRTKRTTKSRTAARKPVLKTSARKKSAAKKTAAQKPNARRKIPVRKAARAVAAPKKAAKPQRVAVSHYNNADFESGLRTYAQYRDLGMVDATNGMVRAHVLRFTEPCDPKVVSKLHYHDTQFQMVYVLKGWVKTKLGDHDEITMRQGSSWTQPPKIKHVINDYSDDCELLEIILPAEFETVEI